jgi:iron complex transport system substrate-binding protein
MAARPQRLSAAVLALVACAVALVTAAAQQRGARPRVQATSARIVSLVPALTEMFFAIGAGQQVVGVGSFDTFPPEITALPRVGALLDPDTERILSLRPTLVVTYGSQAELQTQFARAGIQTYVYRHGGIATIFQTMRDLGDATGRRPEADRAVRDLQMRLDDVRVRVKGRRQPRVLLVIGRQPKTLREIYVSGGRGFLHEMLSAAGGRNVFADVARESVQPSHETLIARAPDVIVELQAEGMFQTTDIAADKAVWSALSSVPAVRNRQVHVLTGQYLVVPGPRFVQATETLARTLHPEAYK